MATRPERRSAGQDRWGSGVKSTIFPLRDWRESAKSVRKIKGHETSFTVEPVHEGVERAVVSLEKTGAGQARRIVEPGGHAGLEFIERDGKLFMQIEGQEVQGNLVIDHTHPVATGPSQCDLDALNLLGQTRSYIVEIEGAESGAQIIRSK
jgi:hypothetical protein